jgi:hypothetical protein
VSAAELWGPQHSVHSFGTACMFGAAWKQPCMDLGKAPARLQGQRERSWHHRHRLGPLVCIYHAGALTSLGLTLSPQVCLRLGQRVLAAQPADGPGDGQGHVPQADGALPAQLDLRGQCRQLHRQGQGLQPHVRWACMKLRPSWKAERGSKSIISIWWMMQRGLPG